MNDCNHIFTFIINGSGGHGKDSFVEFVKEIMGGSEYVWNYSSVAKVKRLAQMMGWDGGKSDKDRKFLADLKKLTTEYSDMSFKDISAIYFNFIADEQSKILFLHIREPNEICRAVKAFSAKTILIKRSETPLIESNDADRYVLDYQYDYVIENEGGLSDLREKAKLFVDEVLKK